MKLRKDQKEYEENPPCKSCSRVSAEGRVGDAWMWETPKARAERLNALAKELPEPPKHLPEKEKRYMRAVRDVYIRYIRHEITRKQAAAERKMYQSALLQERNDFGWRGSPEKQEKE